MNKKFVNLVMFGALFLASTGTFVSCQDYDDDIKKLQGQIDANKNEIDQIKALVNSGQWIKSVVKSDNGIIVTMGDDKTFEITNGKDGANGTNGTAGQDGKPGTVVTLSASGEWLLDGQPTGRYGVATDGRPGLDGNDGADGIYYVPGMEGAEAGFWVKVDPATGTRTVTADSWKTAGSDNVTAVMSGSNLVLTINNETYTIPTGVATLRSLVFVPDMILEGVPAIECSLLKFQPIDPTSGETGGIINAGSSMACTPVVEATYHLNPSNVTAEMIDTENLQFIYRSAQNVTRNANSLKNKAAAYVAINDGKITVTASVDGLNLYNTKSSGTINNFDLIALQAPVSAAAKSFSSDAPEVVTSDYVTLYGGDEYNGRDLYPAHKDLLSTAGDNGHFVSTLQEAKDMPLTDPRVLRVVYNSNIDLNDYIETCYVEGTSHSKFKYSDRYHLSYTFQKGTYKYMMTEAGLLVETDQQAFIKVDETGIATPQVYTEDGNKAAIDRTPIVRALLQHKEGNEVKTVKVAYIKLLITDEQGTTPTPGERIYKMDLPNQNQSLCASVTTEITAEQMNVKVYSQMGVSKERFHQLYTFDAAASTLGVVESANAGGQKTYGLTWTITPIELWNNAGKTLSSKAVYKAANNDKVIIELSTKVADKEIVSIPDGQKIPNYWNDNFTETKLNVAIPAVSSTDATLCVFENNLNAPFYTDRNGKLEVISSTSLYAGAETEFVFDSTPVASPSGYRFTLNNGNTELWSGSEMIAKIDNTLTAAPWNQITLNESSAIAKELLNTNNFVVNLKLKADKCGFDVPFANNGVIKAKFLRPVHVKTIAPGNFIDGVDVGASGSYLAPESVVSYYDWRGKWETNYAQYYGVVAAVIDDSRPKKCTLGVDGALIELPTTLDVYTDASGRFIYRNNSIVLGKPFDIVLPIKITYKWGTVNTEVTIHVVETTTVQGAKKK